MSLYTSIGNSMLVLKGKEYTNIYIYNNTYYIYVSISEAITVLSYSSNAILFKSEFLSNMFIKQTEKTVNDYIYLWDFFFFNKVTIKGKSFKIRKKNKFTNFVLNTSHITWSISTNNIVKKLKKYKLFYLYSNPILFNAFIYRLLYYRYLNIFTKRGLRLGRMLVHKKKGKTNMKI